MMGLPLLGFFLVCAEISAVSAAEVVGVEDGDDAGESPARAEPPAKTLPKATRNTQRESYPEEESDSFIKDVGFSGSVGFSGGFTASLALSLGLNRYTAINVSGFYQSWKTDDEAEVRYGPEIDFVLRLPNPTMFTPYAGAGPGFEKWKREKNGEDYDLSSSLTANYFVGLNLSLSRNFGFQIQSKWTSYVNDPPRDFKDPNSKEPQTQSRIGIGFYFSI